MPFVSEKLSGKIVKWKHRLAKEKGPQVSRAAKRLSTSSTASCLEPRSTLHSPVLHGSPAQLKKLQDSTPVIEGGSDALSQKRLGISTRKTENKLIARSYQSITSLDSLDQSAGVDIGIDSTHSRQDREQLQSIPIEHTARVTSTRRNSRDLAGSKKDWDKLRALRTQAIGLRSRLQKQRRILIEKDAAKQASDQVFMKFLREDRPVHSSVTFEKLYGQLQNTRDEYGPVLEDYAADEDALDEVEFEIWRIENLLYSATFGPVLDTQDMADPPQEGIFANPFPSPSPFLGLVTGVQDQFQPRQAEYLSRLGDLDLAKERLNELLDERFGLVAEQDALSKCGRELGDDLKALLTDLPAQEEQLRSKITQIETDVERLRLDCVEEEIDVEGSDDGSGYSRSLYEEDIRQEKG